MLRILPQVLLATAFSFAFPAQNAAPAGNGQKGKQLFESYGCYQCHGREAQGGAGTGPKRWLIVERAIRSLSIFAISFGTALKKRNKKRQNPTKLARYRAFRISMTRWRSSSVSTSILSYSVSAT